MKRIFKFWFCFIVIIIVLVPDLPGQEKKEGQMTENKKSMDIFELIRSARNLRELLWQDPQRPRYHLMPPEGFFNDANGAIFWNGRYHLFYLARTPIPDPEKPGLEKWVAIWDHASSRDLVHWIYHPPAVRPRLDGSTPLGIYSGGAIKNAPKPTLIYHVPGQGICISIAQDDDLINWKELPENPVIPLHKEGDEFVVFDPCGWYENGKYYALIGNKNHRPGYEGDCSSRRDIKGRVPNDQGFDYYWGPLGANDNGSVYLWDNRDSIGPDGNMAGLTRSYTDKAITFLEENKDKPFLLYLAHTMVHVVVDASSEFKGKSKNGLYGDAVEELDFHTSI